MSESQAILLAGASAICFGTALVTAKVGLRSLDARAGAAISIPSASVLLVLAAPFTLDAAAFDARAAGLFALVGLVFPAVVTLITFASNDRLGPSVTGTVSSTAPLFALAAALVLLGERIPARALIATAGVVAGVALLSWRGGRLQARSLWLPLAGAGLRGVAQVVAKAGLALWPSPFAASLIGYAASTATVTIVDRVTPRARATRTRGAVLWFMATGVLNGAAVLLMYSALSAAPVSLVAPVVAGYPLVTLMLGAAALREERLSARVVTGAVLIAGAIAYLVAAPARAAEQCPIPGERIHWAADVCMARLQTDDEIAAGDCIGEESRRAFANDCEAKRYYKRALCELAVERKQQRDVAACVADPGFAGSTVRNGGVGG